MNCFGLYVRNQADISLHFYKQFFTLTNDTDTAELRVEIFSSPYISSFPANTSENHRPALGLAHATSTRGSRSAEFKLSIHKTSIARRLYTYTQSAGRLPIPGRISRAPRRFKSARARQPIPLPHELVRSSRGNDVEGERDRAAFSRELVVLLILRVW